MSALQIKNVLSLLVLRVANNALVLAILSLFPLALLQFANVSLVEPDNLIRYLNGQRLIVQGVGNNKKGIAGISVLVHNYVYSG